MKILIICTALLLSACAPTKYYTEQFSSIAVSGHDNKLIVLGDRYDYVFDMPGSIQNSLNSSFVDHLTCSFNRPTFIGEDGQTLASVRLDLTGKATEAQIEEAFDLGYSQNDEGLIYYSYSLHGRRVTSANINKAKMVPLNQTFSFKVSDSQQANDQMMMMAPVVVGVGTAGMIATFPASLLLSLPMMGLKP